MARFKSRWLVALFLGFFMAPVSASDVFFEYPDNDLSLTYLNFLFGPLTGVGIYLQHNALSFAIVKILVFSISAASILAGWAVFLGTFRSSTEGKFLGEKLSQSSVILRGVVGLALLTPDGTGYAPIQRIFMSFILMGVSLANSLWGIVVDRYSKGDSLLSSASEGTTASKILTNQLMADGMLLSYLFSIGEIVDFKVDFDQTQKYVQVQVLPARAANADYSAPLVLFQSSGGTLDADMLPGLEQSLRSFTFDSLAIVAGDEMAELATSGKTSMTTSDMTEAYSDVGMDSGLLNALTTNSYAQFYALMAKERDGAADDIKKYLKDGWVMAGALYWMLSQSFTPQNYSDSLYPASQATGVPTGAYINVDNWLADISSAFYDPGIYSSFQYQLSVTNAQSAYGQYGNSGNSYSSPATSSIDAQMAGLSFSFSSLDDTFERALSGADPFLGFIIDCQAILRGVLIFMITTLLVMVTLTLIATLLKDKVPLAHTIMVTLSMIVFLVLSFSFIVIPGAAFGGYYLPLVPMMIFTASVIAWFMKVIEAIVAAPFVAVSFLEPSQDDFGRGNASILLLLHVIAKPALIMIGYILSSRLMILALSLYSVPLNAFLQSTIFPATSSHIAYQRAMTMILVCDTTVAVVVALTTRSFALIYKIPDRVFGWIGHNASGSDVHSIVGEVRSGAEQGIKMMSRIFEMSVAAGKTAVQAMKMAGDSSGG